jgi:hypothetical protein
MIAISRQFLADACANAAARIPFAPVKYNEKTSRERHVPPNADFCGQRQRRALTHPA